MGKLGARDRAQLVVFAYEAGMIEIGGSAPVLPTRTPGPGADGKSVDRSSPYQP